MSHHAETLSDAVHEAFNLIADSGPIAVDEVLRRLAECDYYPEPDQLIDELVDDHHVWWIAEHLLLPDRVLAAARLSHRLTAAEIEGSYIDADPDLHLLILDCSSSFMSPLGELADDYATNERRLVGPPGWLDGFEAGQLAAISWRAAGEVAIEAVEPTALGDGSRQIEAMRHAFASLCCDGETTQLIDVLFGAWQRDHDVFHALQPSTGELVAAAGLSVSGDEVGRADIDWDDVYGKRMAHHAAGLADEHDLDPRSAAHLATLAVSSLWDDASQYALDVAACADALRDPDATDAFLEVKTDREPKAIARLRILATRVEEAHDDCAGAALVLARCAELEGDALAHAREVDRSLRIDGSFWPARAERAWVRSDTGNARGALDDLAFCGDEPPDFEGVATFAGRGPITGGRNEPCGCGSGVKHKLCCGPHNGYPLALRAMWLYVKALWFAWRPGQRADVEAMLSEVVASLDLHLDFAEPEDIVTRLDTFVGDPVVLDAALFGGGLVRRFRDERRLLLPHDEAALLDEWLSARPGLYRVEAWVDDTHVELLDLVNDERVRAAARAPALAIGDVIVSCLLSDGFEPTLLGWNYVRADTLEAIRDGLRRGDALAATRAQVDSTMRAATEAMARIDPAMQDEGAWLFPRATAEQLATLSARELVAIEYPESAAAAERGDRQVDAGDMLIHPRLHLAVHTVVAEQILRYKPKEMWLTALRLSSLGFPRDDILHMLFTTVLIQLRAADATGVWDHGEQIEMLRGLPESFYEARAEMIVSKATLN